MTTYLIRPTSQAVGAASYAASAGTDLACVSDNSDATYLRKSSTTAWAKTIFDLADPAITAGEVVDHISGFVRYKGTNGKMHAVAVTPADLQGYEAAAGFFANSAAAATVEPGWGNHDWEAYPPSTARLLYYSEELGSDSNRAYIYELGANVYTVSPATITPSATTEASSVFATIPLSTVFPLETWADNGQNYYLPVRTMLIEIQVESGGTGYGTGTVVATQTKTVVYDENATIADSITLTTGLSNATYKVYARATRYTTQGKTVVGSWSAAATLTMQAAPPSAPNDYEFTVEPAYAGVRVMFYIPASSGYSSPTLDVERSSDGGYTWTPVRRMTGLTTFFDSWDGSYDETMLDFEAPRGVDLLYRARVTATKSGAVNTSAWYEPTETVQVSAAGWNLKAPSNTAAPLSLIGATVVGNPSEDVTEDVGIFRPLDRRYPVVVAGTLGGWDGQLEIRTATAAEWTALKALIEAQQVLYLESPFGWSKYIRIANGAQTSVAGTPGAPRRSVTLAYVETEAP